MAYREHITIALIRDNGERRSYRLPLGWFRFFVAGSLVAVPLCGLALWQAWEQWQLTATLTERLVKVENEADEARATAHRLKNLEILLDEAKIDGREYVLQKLAQANAKLPSIKNAMEPEPAGKQQPAAPADSGAPTAEATSGTAAAPATGAGAGATETAAAVAVADSTAGESTPPAEGESTPGAAAPQQQADDSADQEQFQGVDTGLVRVDNVTVRQVQPRRLRIALDLRNAGKVDTAAGSVDAVLLSADGERIALRYTVEDAGHFRISVFKRAVMLSRLPSHVSLTNAQVILEIRSQDNTLVYSNLYPVEVK